MTIGGTVKMINETVNLVFVTVACDEDVEIQLRFKSDDPRVAQFAFRQPVVIEVNTSIDTPRLRIA